MPDPVVQLEDVRKTFGAGERAVEAVRGITHAFEAGRFTAILGPSGSGKSTLLHLASGLERPTGGRVRLLGHDLAALPDGELARLRRRSIGLVFQFFNLVPTLTVEENALLPVLLERAPAASDRERLDRLLDRLGLADRRRRLPEELSGGERQRAAIARAMLPAPALLLADEPTGNLDSVTGALITGLLKEQAHAHGVSLVVVTHDLRVAGQADEVLELRDGRIEAR